MQYTTEPFQLTLSKLLFYDNYLDADVFDEAMYKNFHDCRLFTLPAWRIEEKLYGWVW